jgi:hypothetical protein
MIMLITSLYVIFCVPPWNTLQNAQTSFLCLPHMNLGNVVEQWLRCCATNRKVTGTIPAGVTGIFHWYKILRIALWPWDRLNLYQKWVPGVFPGGKGGRCVRLTTLPQSCAVVMLSGNPNFLEPFGPLQAYNGTALSLPVHRSNTGLVFISIVDKINWRLLQKERANGTSFKKKVP